MKLSTRVHIASLGLKNKIEFASIERKIAKSRAAEDKKENEEAKNASLNNNAAEKTTKETEKAKDPKVVIMTEAEAAEQEFPKDEDEEEVDVVNEAFKEEATVSDVGQANMSGGYIRDEDPNLINLAGGIVIDVRKLEHPGSDNVNYQPPMNPQMVQQPVQQPIIQQPMPVQQPPIMAPQQPFNIPQVIPNANENEYLEYLEKKKQMAANVKVGFGNHKIDNPPIPKPPVVKAKEDNVDLDIDCLKINVEEKPPKKIPDIISETAEQPEPIVEKKEPVFDNSFLKNKYRFISDIEKIALKNDVQVKFLERVDSEGRPNGLISCIAYTAGKAEPNVFKSFTIDTGHIIDRRAKVFPIIVDNGFEDYQAYPVLIPKKDEDKGKSKSKNVINEKLFDDIFKGGVAMLNPKGMYTPEYLELNKVVALITMPTNNMNAETRKKVRDRLLDALRSGVFTSALQIEPFSRFMFKSYDKKTECFTLTNVGVPFRFAGPYIAKKGVEIHFGIGETKIITLN